MGLLFFACAIAGCSGGHDANGNTAADGSANASSSSSSGTPDAASQGTTDAPDLLGFDAGGVDAAIPPFTDPYGGGSGCPDGGASPKGSGCVLMVPLEGAIASTIYSGSAGECSYSTSSGAFGGAASDSARTENVTFDIVPAATLATGATGAATVSVLITAAGSDGAVGQWRTPATCTIDIASDVCLPPSGLGDFYGISGTGTCPDPAMPVDGQGASVTIGSFYFVSERPVLSDQ